ncbi:thioredoxin domain-containing protein [Marinoscillum furvescens]|nr:thioredoxin domain-containing protein [Marinoscillum furvescens]
MTSQENAKHTNRLIDATSPYLLQHAHNPVDWYPWGDEAFAKAKEENKPVLLSIGYSSCHWCHVMAHESFENEEIAALMNEKFINIKLDREERPDIDNIYMEAVQAMGLNGGWPLNVFLTPDQKPFYGGTYFPPEQWTKLINAVDEAYTNNYDKLYESASKFAASIQQSESEKYGLSEVGKELEKADFDSLYDQLAKRFDSEWGGLKKAPKFPMPALWNMLLTYSHAYDHQEAQSHLLFTLNKIADGGIYDHIGGGFSRYSVDGEWHVPHFEKMLYDNGQLLSLYAQAYKLTKDERYLEVIKGTTNWISREMLDETGGFYSALDADSEGEEGKFYVWTFDEVKALAGDDFSVIAEYFDIQQNGNWEHGKNVLRRLERHQDLANELNLSSADLQQKVTDFTAKALEERAKRVRPGLDSKIISGWNGLTLSGLCDSYQATQDPLFADLAKKNAAFLKNEMIENGRLLRIHGQSTQGYMEDYAAVIQAFTDYYETFFDVSYLDLARDLTNQTLEQFFDEKEHLFYFTGDQAENLIARKKEVFDNVIPASNSIMAKNLYRLGLMYDNDEYKKTALGMVLRVNKLIKQEAEYLSNWAAVSLMASEDTPEVILVGAKALNRVSALQSTYLPNKILMATEQQTDHPPLLEHKSDLGDGVTYFICYNKVCKQPLFEIEPVLSQLQSSN